MLLTNGCSFAWGDELPGCEDAPPTHWDYNFTSICAKELGIESANISCCGAGNDKIFRDTVAFLNGMRYNVPCHYSSKKAENEPVTHLSIMWSAPKRSEVFEIRTQDQEERMNIQRFQSMSQYSPERTRYLKTNTRDIAELYANMVLNENTGMIKMFSYMQAIQSIADGMGIKVIQSIFHSRLAYCLLYAFTEKKKYSKDYCEFLLEQLKTLRPECSLGIRYINFLEEQMKLPIQDRAKIPDIWESIPHVDGKPFPDENNWWDMYSMGTWDDPCKIEEFGHPNPHIHELTGKRFSEIFEKNA